MSDTTFASAVTYFGIEAGPGHSLRALLAREIEPLRVQDQIAELKGITREFRRWTPQSKRNLGK